MNKSKNIKNPKLSIIMPTLNAEKYLRESIDSILDQTFKDFEFLIIDDNSTDNTLKIINNYKDKRIKLIKGKNKGIASALNLGIKNSKGEYIARMDADDISLPKRLEKQIDFMDKNIEFGICGTKVKPLTTETIHKNWGNWFKTNPKFIDILSNCAFCHPTVMIRKSIIKKHDLYYNEKIHYTEDQELWFRAIKITKFHNLEDQLLIYRLHKSNKSNKNYQKQQAYLKKIKIKSLQWIGLNQTNQKINIQEKIEQIKNILNSNNSSDVITQLYKENSYLREETKKLNDSVFYIPYKIYHSIKKKLNTKYIICSSYRIIRALFFKPIFGQYNLESIDQIFKGFIDSNEKINPEIIYKKQIFYETIKDPSKIDYVFYTNKQLDQSLRYRVENICYALNKNKINSEIIYEGEEYKFKVLENISVVIVFRSINKYFEKIIMPNLIKNKITLIYDIDDYIFNPTDVDYVGALEIGMSNKERKWHKNQLHKFKNIMKKFKYGTATTSFLCEKMSKLGINAKVIKNTINIKQYNLAQKLNKKKIFDNQKIKICYLSGSKSHNKDFRIFEDTLEIILKKYKNIEFHIVGFLNLNEKFTKYNRRIIRHEFMPYLDLLKYLSKMDINIAPLELNNPFTAGKSELKIFEAALVKVPSVVSPVDSYSKCINNNVNGFLAKNTNEWVKYLSLLIEDKNIRQKIANQAYNDFVKIFYVKNNIENISSVYNGFIKDKQNAKQRRN